MNHKYYDKDKDTELQKKAEKRRQRKSKIKNLIETISAMLIILFFICLISFGIMTTHCKPTDRNWYVNCSGNQSK